MLSTTTFFTSLLMQFYALTGLSAGATAEPVEPSHSGGVIILKSQQNEKLNHSGGVIILKKDGKG